MAATQFSDDSPTAEQVFDFPTLFDTDTGIRRNRLKQRQQEARLMRKLSAGQDPGSAVNSSAIAQPYWVPNVSAYSASPWEETGSISASALLRERGPRLDAWLHTIVASRQTVPGGSGAPNYAATGVNLIDSSPNCGMMGITIQQPERLDWLLFHLPEILRPRSDPGI